MAAFKAYFDESGIDSNSPLLVVGGAIARVSTWRSFCPQWEAVLKKNTVKMYHSADYNTKHGEFANKSEEERFQLTDTLLKVIDSDDYRAIAAIVDKDEFVSTVREFQSTAQGQGFTMSAYQFLCYFCCVQVSRFQKLRRHIEQIEVVFESGNKLLSGHVSELADELNFDWAQQYTGIEKISKDKKGNCVPFQLADMIAYEIYKAYARLDSGAATPPRYQAQRLNKIMKGHSKKLSHNEILKLLTAFA